MDLNELLFPKILTPSINGQREEGLFVSMRKEYLGPYLVVFALLRVKHLAAGDKELPSEVQVAWDLERSIFPSSV